MANRVIIGDRNGQMGMWVSRPGYNVLTAADADMIFVASDVLNTRSFQTVQQGGFTLTTGQSIQVAFPYMGIIPIILCWTSDYFYNPIYAGIESMAMQGLDLVFPSATVAQFTAVNPYQSYTSTFYYVITNQSVY